MLNNLMAATLNESLAQIVANISTYSFFTAKYYIIQIYHIVYLLIKFGLFPFFGSYKSDCFEYSSTSFSTDT